MTQQKNIAQVLEEEFKLLHDRVAYSKPGEGEDAERCYRRNVHELKEKQAALCLSGGGVRSATFGLGVLQALAARGQLGKFHYMSSVSGGGYIASWLSSWIARESSLQEVMNQLGNPTTPEAPQIRRLRAYSNYLSPVRGLSMDLLALIATFIRNLALHWLILLPLLGVVVMLPRFMLALGVLCKEIFIENIPAYVVQVDLFLLTILSLVYIFSKLPSYVRRNKNPNKKEKNKTEFQKWCFLPIVLLAIFESILWPDARKILKGDETVFLVIAGAFTGLMSNLLIYHFFPQCEIRRLIVASRLSSKSGTRKIFRKKANFFRYMFGIFLNILLPYYLVHWPAGFSLSFLTSSFPWICIEKEIYSGRPEYTRFSLFLRQWEYCGFA
jgi:hypothetical protein